MSMPMLMQESTLLTAEECEDLARRVLEMTNGSKAQVDIGGTQHSRMRFARGDSHMASERTMLTVDLVQAVGDRVAGGSTNQVDDAGLQELVSEVEALIREQRTEEEWDISSPQVYPESPQIFFESILPAMAGGTQADVVRGALAAAENEGLVAAGEVGASIAVRAGMNTNGLSASERKSYGEFSLTARTKDGTGSGWARSGYEDWGRVDVQGVISRAVDVAVRSAAPVGLEPGRYTVILEPEAVAELIHPIMGYPTQFWSARLADGGDGPFANEPRGTNKIGLQMMDRRLGMVSDPWDPERPASTIGPAPIWQPVERVVWFDEGMLRNLAYDTAYARDHGRSPVRDPGGVRLAAEGPPQTLEEMIASTRRGVWVHRLSGVSVMHFQALVLTGTTRDGTFLIENGKVTKPIKNFRFTDSPFFIFNQLEAWGQPIRASWQVVAPRLKLRDFNFTSLSDAI